MKMSLLLKKLMVFVVSVFMFIGNIGTHSIQVNAEESSDDAVHVTNGIEWEKVDSDEIKGLELKNAIEEELTEADLIKNGNVRVSIVVDGSSTIEAGYSAQGIANNAGAKAYRAKVLNNQKALARKISAEALNGKELDVVWNLTLAANIISANVPYIKIESIKKVAGVKDVVIENRYEAADPVASDEPNMAVATDMTGANLVYSDYTGAGQAIAIIDTGLDTDHRSFDASAFDYAIESLDEDVDLIDKRDVAAVFDELNASQRLSSARAKDVYLSTKVPFAFNYVDFDLDVTHDNDGQGGHGSHVAGIAAANRYVEKNGEYVDALDEVKVQGQSPDAQIIVMKVFGKGGGAYDADYFAAIEDAMVLGAASANLSLGSTVAGLYSDSTYADLLKEITENDTVVVMSAGNNSYWAENSTYGYLYGEDSNYATGGSPGSFTNAFTVASNNNDGYIGSPMVVDGNNVFFDDGSGPNNRSLKTMPGEFGYILIDGYGTAEEMAAIADVLKGKIAVVKRGELNFSEKATNAVANGAIATIIYNNQPGTISMDLSNYQGREPAVSITEADGAVLKACAEAKETADGAVYYEGTLTVSEDIAVAKYDSDYVMSTFSSWGPTGDLNLKPEITAPGGNIYSINGVVPGGQAYEVNSGTSMAAPEISGLAALAHQYIDENDLVAKTGLTKRQLTMSLMMSTATPLVDPDTGNYYPVIQQGAGFANIADMMRAKSFIMVEGTTVNGKPVEREAYTDSYADGKVKAMLGADAERTGKYSITYKVTNFSDEDVAYDFSADFFTQDLFMDSGIIFRDTWTTSPLPAAVTFTVDGETLEAAAEGTEGYDFNDDGVVNTYDGVALLQYVVGTRKEIAYEENADLDEDGDVDTYDAYLALSQLSESTTEVKPGQTITVTASVDMNGSLDFYGSEDFNGNYVEGYLFVKETASEEGAEGAEHSIPVLGYFGNWSEPEPHDKGSYLEYSYGIENRFPYMYDPSALGESALTNEAFLVKYPGDSRTYLFGGNPVANEEEYHPERNAINSKNTLTGLQFTAIRNAGAQKVEVTDDSGKVLYEAERGSLYGAYYYPAQGVWENTRTTASIGYTAGNVKEGTVLTYSYTMAPEYYVNDGEADWDALSENATQSISAVIDNTAPEITGEEPFELVTDESGAITGLKVSAKDNQYIAAIALFDETDKMVGMFGSDESETAAAGDEKTYKFEINDETNKHLYLDIYDYAANETLYRINLNGTEELDDDVSVLLDTDEIYVLVNSTAKVTADVRPWGVDTSVTWTSADESIATVDADGIVTGVAEGTTTVTAVSVLDPNATAAATVYVSKIDKLLNGIVWDENGEVWFSEFNTNSLPDYEKLSGSMRMPIASAAYDENGTLYAASLDSDNMLSSLYTVNEETYELNEIGASSYAYMDLCKAPALGGDYMLAVYGTYLLIVNKTTGDQEGGFNLAEKTNSANLVGIAYEELYESDYGPSDIVWLIDANGVLYETGVLLYGGKIQRFEVNPVGQIADGVDMDYFQSLYYDGANLFFSRFNYADNKVNLVMVEDIYHVGNIWNIGSFEDGVWPVGGLYEKGVYDVGMPAGDDTGRASLVIEAEAEKEITKLTTGNTVRKGGLNTVSEESDSEDKIPNNSSAVTEATMTITTDAEDTNALYTVEYDPEALELVNAKGLTKYNAVNTAEEGKVVIGFINEEALAEGTDVATLQFRQLDPETKTEVVITTAEENDEKPGTSETFIFGYEKGVSAEAVFNEPTWEWSEDSSMAVATFVSEDGEIVNKINAAENGKITEEVTKPATCEEEGEKTYTAEITVDFKTVNGETTFTNVKTVTIEATGHDWNEGEVTTAPTCEEEGIMTYTCKNDPEHTRTEVIPATGHKWGEWEYDRATNTFTRVCENDPEHTETKDGEVVVFNDPTWEWSEDGSMAVAKFEDVEGITEVLVNAAENGKITKEVVKEATCEEDGEVTYTAEITIDFKTESGETTFTDVKTVTLNATGHSWSEWVLDRETNSYVRTCENDPEHKEVVEGKVLRIFGDTRYETSFKLADLLKEELGVDTFDTVVVASGAKFADALSGSYLADKNSAPILLTSESNDEAVREYIKANLKEGGKVYILGGPAAVSATFEEGLDGYDVKRLAGEDRYETNIAILEEAGVEGEDIIISTGTNYADSLSASAAKKPILLVNHKLEDSHRQFLKDAKAGKFYVVGGTMAVSSRVDTQLGAYGSVERLAGEDRFETSKLVAEKFVENPDAAVLVYSHNFPDGLCGGPIASAINAPVLLTNSENYTGSMDYVLENGIITGFVVGGESLISDEAVVDVFTLQSAADILTR